MNLSELVGQSVQLSDFLDLIQFAGRMLKESPCFFSQNTEISVFYRLEL